MSVCVGEAGKIKNDKTWEYAPYGNVRHLKKACKAPTQENLVRMRLEGEIH